MSNAIVAKDPRGVVVICTRDQWDTHILVESCHIELKGNEEAVKAAIEHPDCIYKSNKHEEREVYFKKTVDTPLKLPDEYSDHSAQILSNQMKHIKVIVEIGGGYGNVVSAFTTKHPTGGVKGEPIYVTSNTNEV